MKINYGFIEGDEVRVKGNSYGCGKIHRLLPVGSHDLKYKLAEVLWATDWNWDFALIKVFALRNLMKREL